MSLEAAVMDLTSSFAYGQGYVALSRVRTLQGLYLLGWNERALMIDPTIQQQDTAMREQSKLTERAWAARSSKERQQQQEDFIRARGGRLRAKKSSKPSVTPTDEVATTHYTERLARIRKTYPQAYTPWTQQADERLAQLFQAEKSVKEIAQELERHPGAIRSRLTKLGLTG